MSFNSQMESQKMRFNSFVIKNTVTAASLPTAATLVTKNNLPVGAGVFVDMSGKRITTLPATGYFKFVYHASTTRPMVETHPMTQVDMVKTKQKYVAPVEQVTTIGYNGTSGNFPFANSTSYGIMFRIESDSDCFGGNKSWPYTFSGQYKTSTTASAIEAAIKAADALFSHVNQVKSDISGTKPDIVRITVETDAAPTAIAQTATVGNGSKEITLSAAAPGTLLVGDFISIGPVEDIYQIAAISGANVKLTTKWRGGNVVGLAVAEHAVVTATSLAGVKLSAISDEFDPIMFQEQDQVYFSVSINSALEGVGAVIATTKPYAGNGTYEQVAGEELSSLYRNNLGTLPTFTPNLVPTMFSEAGKKYSCVDAKWEDKTNSDGPLGHLGKTFGNFRLWLELDGADDIVATMAADSLAETLLVADYATGDLNA